MKVYVVRHGETNETIGNIMQGNMDTVLNDKGKKQARLAREQIKDKGIDIIIASPKARTKETAEIISDGKIPIIYDERLKSRNHGEFEGMSRLDMDLKTYWNININKQYEKAESVGALYHRVSSLLEMVKRFYPNKTVLLVTHSGVCRILYYYFNGIPSDGDLTAYEAHNGLVEEYEL